MKIKYVWVILLFITHGSSCQKNNIVPQMVLPSTTHQPITSNADTVIKSFTYLALGDSYTIGHDVPAQDNFPNQTITLLKNDNLLGQLKIIATTGWTTTNLKQGLENDKTLLSKYDIVTLLIGVNNEYQGAPIEIYKTEFEELLKKSISLAGDSPGCVIVLSIPDWGVTPFASGRDREQIAKEIDNYNGINKTFSEKYGTQYINITDWTREAANDPTLLASDGLHPSAKEYARWAERLEMMISEILK